MNEDPITILARAFHEGRINLVDYLRGVQIVIEAEEVSRG